MKINFLLPHIKISGGVRIGLNYAQFLAERGHKVTVLTVSKKFWRRNLANFLRIKIKWYNGFKPKVLRVKSFAELNIPNCDAAIACDYTTASHLEKYSISKGAKFHIIMHDERLYHGKKEDVEEVYKRSHMNKIVISNWIKQRIKSDFNQDPHLLITPVDFNLFYKVEQKKDPSKLRILMLDHSYDWKGVREGLQAYNFVKRRFPSIELVMFGVRNKKSIKECDEYHYRLPQKKLAELYSSCDIFLCPSWYEGLGMPAMEAMACETAVVTFDTGGSRDYAFDMKTAFVAKHRNVSSLSGKLSLAVSDKALRERIAKQGYDFIHNGIDSWEESSLKLEKIILQNLKNK